MMFFLKKSNSMMTTAARVSSHRRDITTLIISSPPLRKRMNNYPSLVIRVRRRSSSVLASSPPLSSSLLLSTSSSSSSSSTFSSIYEHPATTTRSIISIDNKTKRRTFSSSSSSSSMTNFFNPTEEHRQLRSMLQDFVQNEIEPQAQGYNRSEKLNLPLLRQLGDLGLLGLTVEEEYGGSNMDATAVVLVHEELASSDPAFCLSYLAHSLLLVNNLHVNGNHEQKLKHLPDLCSGHHIGGMAMSEPSAGTDVLGMKTKAVVQEEEEQQQNWILNGQKMWITNGTLGLQNEEEGGGSLETGDLFLVYAKTGPNRSDITSFLVEKNMKGFTVGQQIHDKLGMRASPTAELVFDHVELSSENVVGDINQATLCMMRNLEIERLGLAAMGLGIARRCINIMKDYANERQAFGKTLWEFGQIQQCIATSYAEYMAGRSYVYAMAQNLDLTTYGNGLDADGTKLYCAQMSKTVADRAIQVLGGYGYVGEYNVERLWRDAKLLEIGGGTNESHHKNMSRDLQKMTDGLE